MRLQNYNNELLLVWKDFVSKRRIPIAKLWQEDGYKFKYIRTEENQSTGVDVAIDLGYTPFGVFSDLSKVYYDKELFDLFLNRLPLHKRDQNPFIALLQSRGKLPIDNLEFILADDFQKKKRKFEFTVTGFKYFAKEVGQRIKVEENLTLKFNVEDSRILEIWTECGNYKLGFVPDEYADYIDKVVMNQDEYILKIMDVSEDTLRAQFIGTIVKPPITVSLVLDTGYHSNYNDSEYKAYSMSNYGRLKDYTRNKFCLESDSNFSLDDDYLDLIQDFEFRDDTINSGVAA